VERLGNRTGKVRAIAAGYMERPLDAMLGIASCFARRASHLGAWGCLLDGGVAPLPVHASRSISKAACWRFKTESTRTKPFWDGGAENVDRTFLTSFANISRILREHRPQTSPSSRGYDARPSRGASITFRFLAHLELQRGPSLVVLEIGIARRGERKLHRT